MLRLLPFAALLACTPEEEDTDKGTLEPADSAEIPHENAPVITSFTVEEGDPIQTEDGETQPTVRFTVEFEDDDGDANVIDLAFWADTAVDNAADTSGAALGTITDQALTNSSGEIVADGDGFGGTLYVQQGVTGGDLEFSTEYEFAAIVYDSVNTASAAVLAVGTTPAPLE